MFKSIALFFVLRWLLGSTPGAIVVLLLILWAVDNRFIGIIPALFAPLRRARRIAALKRAVRVNPSDVRSMVDLGEHYLQGRQPALAADYLQKALARGEDGARATYLLGAALVRLGHHAEGRVQLEAALAKQYNVAFGLPYLYLLEETFATAGKDVARVEELVQELKHFESVEVLTRAARICSKAGRRDLAMPLLEEAVHNYSLTPRTMRRQQRRWALLARLSLWRVV